MNFRPGYLEQGTPVGNLLLGVSLIADNTVVNQVGYGVVAITSDNTTAANRTFTLTNGEVVGKVLVLYMASGSSTTCELADSGNVKLSAAWTPLQYDTLTLMWTGSEYVELARSDN